MFKEIPDTHLWTESGAMMFVNSGVDGRIKLLDMETRMEGACPKCILFLLLLQQCSHAFLKVTWTFQCLSKSYFFMNCYHMPGIIFHLWATRS